MKIACLGWGSLIWRPQNLMIQRVWFNDGPFLPIEYTRKSQDGRLTLVINPGSKNVRTLWALMDTQNLEEAKTSLKIREGIRREDIGSIDKTGTPDDSINKTIVSWANSIDIDSVIWTNLKPKFNEEKKTPTLSDALEYVAGLDINIRQHAEEYIRKTPQQIDTDYRKAFEKEFGWTYLG